MRLKKMISIILVLSFALIIMAGCATSDSKTVGADKELESLSVKVAAPMGAPTLSMIKMFKEKPSFGENVDVSYETINSPDLLASRIISGEIDIAVVPTNLAITLYNRGVDYKLAASTVWGILYLVGNEEVNSWDDLKGKEIHTMGRGLTPDIIFRYLLESNGIDPETDVTLTYMGETAEVASSFIAGKSKIAVIPEPALTNVMSKKEDAVILFDLQEEWSKLNEGNARYPQASLIIKNDLIENYPEFVSAFLEEYQNSINWLGQNLQKAGEYSEELETGLSKGAVINGFSRSNIEYKDVKDAKNAVEAYLSILFEYSSEVIGGKLPDEGFYYTK